MIVLALNSQPRSRPRAPPLSAHLPIAEALGPRLLNSTNILGMLLKCRDGAVEGRRAGHPSPPICQFFPPPASYDPRATVERRNRSQCPVKKVLTCSTKTTDHHLGYKTGRAVRVHSHAPGVLFICRTAQVLAEWAQLVVLSDEASLPVAGMLDTFVMADRSSFSVAVAASCRPFGAHGSDRFAFTAKDDGMSGIIGLRETRARTCAKGGGRFGCGSYIRSKGGVVHAGCQARTFAHRQGQGRPTPSLMVLADATKHMVRQVRAYGI